MQKNTCYTITIQQLNHDGQGIGEIDGIPVIVERALPGEEVEIKIIKAAKKYAVGRLLNVLTPSSDRAEPFCKVFHRCGGCSLQHLSYDAQLRFKTGIIREELAGVGLQDVVVHESLGMREPLHYRNKAQYPVALRQSKLRMGFYANRSHEIVEHDTCPVQPEIFDRITAIVRDFLVTHRISIYDETNHSGLVRHLVMRIGKRTEEILVTLVLNGTDLPGHKTLVNALTSAVPEITGILLNVNSEDTNVITGKEYRTVFGTATLRDSISAHTFEISPRSFYQTNPEQTERLYQQVLDYAELTRDAIVCDLYCGIGTISIFLAHHARQVYGVDVVEDAVRDAVRNARNNRIENVEFLCGPVGRVIPELYEQGLTADVVVVDPPRKGCDEKLLSTLVEMPPKRLIYVSCHPKTLARDLRYLTDNGFAAVEIQPVDMFPHTTHLECVAKLVLR